MGGTYLGRGLFEDLRGPELAGHVVSAVRQMGPEATVEDQRGTACGVERVAEIAGLRWNIHAPRVPR
ncbi:hypothetical protein GCM10010525_20040 [Glutamicibacter bergerei]|uniref:Uncharacterized protein n=1 Tax=Glutamicibacter ardleyensis TaxID=225894 RepID=A0ABQ2D8V5_9MICC|nr:hypothetical protein GCM10007173_03960 [Glutamicibacter ardleyensis]